MTPTLFQATHEPRPIDEEQSMSADKKNPKTTLAELIDMREQTPPQPPPAREEQQIRAGDIFAFYHLELTGPLDLFVASIEANTAEVIPCVPWGLLGPEDVHVANEAYEGVIRHALSFTVPLDVLDDATWCAYIDPDDANNFSHEGDDIAVLERQITSSEPEYLEEVEEHLRDIEAIKASVASSTAPESGDERFSDQGHAHDLREPSEVPKFAHSSIWSRRKVRRALLIVAALLALLIGIVLLYRGNLAVNNRDHSPFEPDYINIENDPNHPREHSPENLLAPKGKVHRGKLDVLIVLDDERSFFPLGNRRLFEAQHIVDEELARVDFAVRMPEQTLITHCPASPSAKWEVTLNAKTLTPRSPKNGCTLDGVTSLGEKAGASTACQFAFDNMEHALHVRYTITCAR